MICAARVQRFIKATSTLKRKLLHEADHDRWMNVESFCSEWDERAKMIAGLIPKGSRVIDFGAGLCQLRSYLDPTCTYVAADVTSRGQDTLILDLEKRPLPELLGDRFDVAVFAGVLEYVSDAPGVVSWLCQYVTTCILSYNCAPRRRHLYWRLREAWDRVAVGWVNAYTEEDLKRLFARDGFLCVRQTQWNALDGSEPIFVFQKAGPKSE